MSSIFARDKFQFRSRILRDKMSSVSLPNLLRDKMLITLPLTDSIMSSA
jgi:hypothetical protein